MRFFHLQRRHWFGIGIATLILGPLILWQLPEDEQEHLVAFVGRTEGDQYAAMHRRALTYYIKQLNEEIPGHRLTLRFFYLDAYEGRQPDAPETLRWIYETQIIPDERFVVVIDNTWAKHIEKVSDLVRDRDLPVLSLNADKGPKNFGGNALFIGHSDNAADDISAYTKKVLQPKTLIFVGEEDYWLTARFLEKIDPKDYTLFRKKILKTDKRNAIEQEDLSERLQTWLRDAPRPAILALNVHDEWGAEIIHFVDQNLSDVTIVAPSFAAREGKSENFTAENGNRLILMTAPEDAVSKKVFRDTVALRERFPDEFADRFNFSFYVKRCLDTVEIVREALIAASSIPAVQEMPGSSSKAQGGPKAQLAEVGEIDRKLFLRFFQKQANRGSIPGRYDLYNFDSKGRIIPEVSFVSYEEGVATSQWQQLNSERKTIPTVFFGIDLLDVGRLDPSRGVFQADFYYWVRLGLDSKENNKKDTSSTEVAAESSIGSYIHFRNLSSINSRTKIDKDDLGNYRLERISGEFNVDFKLEDYPLDTQELTLELELANPFDDVRVAFDYAAFEKGQRRRDSFEINGWELEDYYVTVDNVISQALRGATPDSTREPKKFKTLTVRIITTRKTQNALISVALPLCTIGLAALSLLLIRDLRFGRVGDIYVGVFLSIITYSIAFSQITPATGTITRADYLFYLTFLVVLLVFLRFVLLNALGYTGAPDSKSPKPPRRLVAFGAMAAYCLAVAMIVLLDR
ncbi:MAG: hypothetical protein SX243_24540 [Acidobacteriota bacterium]|nr:hypothetical protein [Acidobacteriota bacterium]